METVCMQDAPRKRRKPAVHCFSSQLLWLPDLLGNIRTAVQIQASIRVGR